MTHIKMRRTTYRNAACHAEDCRMSHMAMRHVTYTTTARAERSCVPVGVALLVPSHASMSCTFVKIP